ncbi:MAG: SUMF1/EgtB/PvdO family nonheme iron enzyme, partial [Deltaproteobacteria bacterium]|nr:SUMF1/EgtB/PvdO family nonheme iron enzyme [Deltaproteobacteria bacterium]
IATSLASDMSKKFTQVRGTPMYQSPESYSGGMGRPADWWGLGMILLEIAAGSHPFKGLSNNIIAYAISTEPVPVPEDLDAGRKELLQGLLTREPEKRWSYEQVVRWLSGERSIPQHFETAPATQAQPAGNAGLKPLKFMDRQYQSLAELAAAFLKDEETWEKGREFLMRGYVRQWLEKNEEFDAIVDMDKAMSGAEDSDEKLFRFAHRFGGDAPFVFGGHLITLENLLLFAGKVLKRQPVTAMEQKITDSIENGVLLSCLNFYKRQGQTSGSLQDLGLMLESLKGKPQGDIAGFLDFCLHPPNYYCPSLQGNTTIENIAKYVSSSPNIPVTVKEQEKKEQERREQERKRREQQKRLEQERREQERREQERREQERREQERRAQEIRDNVWTNSIGMEFVRIPTGTFWMGSADDDGDANDDEKPRHQVTISRPFYLSKYPVTQAQWDAVMGRRLFGLFGNNPSYFKGANRPVEQVSWNDAREFIRTLNAKEGHNLYRLPTEEEWEYACRAGSTGRYCFGDDKSKLEDYAWYRGNSGGGTHPVGQKKPNAWGLYDMHGNVWEWVQDCWYGNYSDNYEMVRGGGWSGDARNCRSARRDKGAPANFIGFRLALSLGH